MAMRESVDRGLDPRQIDAIYVGNFSSELFENQGQTRAHPGGLDRADPAPGHAGGRCLRQRRGGAAPGHSGDCLRAV